MGCQRMGLLKKNNDFKFEIETITEDQKKEFKKFIERQNEIKKLYKKPKLPDSSKINISNF